MVVTVRTGENHFRGVSTIEIVSMDRWDSWSELMGIEINWNQVECVQSWPVSAENVTKRDVMSVYISADMRPVHASDPSILLFNVDLGWDAFMATQFAQINRSIWGAYFRIYNVQSKSVWNTLTTVRSSIQVWSVLREIWAELSILKDPRIGLIQHKEEGDLRLSATQWTVCVNGIHLDKAEMDTLWLCKKSSTRNRTESLWYRGCYDRLCLPSDFQSLDGRYVKDWLWWKQTRSEFHHAGHEKTHSDRVFRMEGWSTQERANMWNPRGIDLNPFFAGRLDVWHTMMTLCRVCVLNIAHRQRHDWSGIVRKCRLALRNVCRLNYTKYPKRLDGDFGLGQTDMISTYESCVFVFLGLRTVCPGEVRVKILQGLLEIFTLIHSLQTGPEVERLQRRVRWVFGLIQSFCKSEKHPIIRPKLRMLIFFAFNQCYLWRSVSSQGLLGVEKKHQHGKSYLSRHTNNQDRDLQFASDYERLQCSMDFLMSGGCCGPTLNYKVSRCVRELSNPLNPMEPLLASPNVSGFRQSEEVELRVDEQRGLLIDEDYWESVMKAEVTQDKMEEMINKLIEWGFLKEGLHWEDYLSGETGYVFRHILKARLIDGSKSDCWSLESGQRKLLLVKSVLEQRYLLDCELIVKVIKRAERGRILRMDNEADRKSVIVVLYGRMMRLKVNYGADDNRESRKHNKAMGFTFHIRNSQMGGQFVSGAAVESGALIQHIHGSRCREREGRWVCDQRGYPEYDVWDPQMIWQPRLYTSLPSVRVVDNLGRYWKGPS